MVIGYTRHHADWQTGPGGATPVDEGAMDCIEAGVKAAADGVDALVAGTTKAGDADKLDGAHLNEVMPVGAIIMWADDALPAGGGWLECNGAAVSTTTYAALYAVVGTHYRIGSEGTGNFRLPDFRGYFPRGWDHGAGVDNTRRFGSYTDNSVMAQPDCIKQHHHHVPDGANVGPYGGGYPGSGPMGTESDTGYDGSTALSTVETRPKNVCVMFLIKYR